MTPANPAAQKMDREVAGFYSGENPPPAALDELLFLRDTGLTPDQADAMDANDHDQLRLAAWSRRKFYHTKLIEAARKGGFGFIGEAVYWQNLQGIL